MKRSKHKSFHSPPASGSAGHGGLEGLWENLSGRNAVNSTRCAAHFRASVARDRPRPACGVGDVGRVVAVGSAEDRPQAVDGPRVVEVLPVEEAAAREPVCGHTLAVDGCGEDRGAHA